jgi:hypothetical protein
MQLLAERGVFAIEPGAGQGVALHGWEASQVTPRSGCAGVLAIEHTLALIVGIMWHPEGSATLRSIDIDLFSQVSGV